MAQQINLFSPILLTPKRYFSALTMVQALAVFGIGLAALAGWSASSTSALQRDLQAATQSNVAERQRLSNLLAQQPAAASATAIEQELAAERRQLDEAQRQLEALMRGRGSAGHSHSAWLRLLAQTMPASAWLTEVKLGDGRFELAGMTLQPEALRPWLAALSAHPLAGGRPLGALKVEHSEAAGPAGADQWVFQIAGGPPAAGAPQ